MKTLLLTIISLVLIAPRGAQSTLPSPRFVSIDILIDPQGEELAAYQIDINAESSNVKLVGVEGGAHPAYSNPPYYDPAALNQNRVILAALSTAKDLPRTKLRVARLHLQVMSEMPAFDAKLITAAKPDGSRVDAKVSIQNEVSP